MLEDLKVIAEQLGISFNKNIGFEALKQRIMEHNVSKGVDPQSNLTPEMIAYNENNKPVNKQILLKQLKLPEKEDKLRVIVRCNNPDKTSLKGEIITLANESFHDRRYIPFNQPWHVSRQMVELLQNSEYSKFLSVKENGIMTSKRISDKQYNIDILPPITDEEVDAIRKRQLLDKDD